MALFPVFVFALVTIFCSGHNGLTKRINVGHNSGFHAEMAYDLEQSCEECGSDIVMWLLVWKHNMLMHHLLDPQYVALHSQRSIRAIQAKIRSIRTKRHDCVDASHFIDRTSLRRSS